MRRQLTKRRQPRRVKPVFDYRPEIFQLEDRRAPGDGLLGALLFGIGAGMELLGTDREIGKVDVRLINDLDAESEAAFAFEPVAAEPPPVFESWVSETPPVNEAAVAETASVSYVGLTEPLAGAIDEDPVAALFPEDSKDRPVADMGGSGLGELRFGGSEEAGGLTIASGHDDLTIAADTTALDSVSNSIDWINPFFMPQERPGGNSRNTGNESGKPPDIAIKCLHGIILNFATGICENPIDPYCWEKDEDTGGYKFCEDESSDAVRPWDGNLKISFDDLQSTGFGALFGHTRTWTNRAGYGNSDWNGNGHGTVVSQWPYLLEAVSPETGYYVVSNGSTAQHFTLDGSVYKTGTDFWTQETMVYDDDTDLFILTDTAGNRISFKDFSPNDYRDGLFYQLKDVYGNVTQASYTSNGRIAEIQRCNSGSTICESYVYTYYGSGANIDQLEQLEFKRYTSSSGWTTAQKVKYYYYVNSDSFGSDTDLKLVEYYAGTSSTPYDTAYYRYYDDPTYHQTTNPGYQHGLRLVFDPASLARLKKDYPTTWSTESNATVDEYAQYEFEYNEDRQVTKRIVQGEGGTTGGGRGTYNYSYSPNNDDDTQDKNHNAWAVKTVQELPDHVTGTFKSQRTIFTNEYAEIMLDVYEGGTWSSPSTWATFYLRDTKGRVTMKAHPSAVSGYTETSTGSDLDDLMELVSGNYEHVEDSVGLVEKFVYNSDSATTAPGYFKEAHVQRGEDGHNSADTTAKLKEVAYTSHAAHADNGGATIFPVSSTTVYRNPDGTGGLTTSYSYDSWYENPTGKATNRPKIVSVTTPTVGTSENGEGVADEAATFFNEFGLPVWTRRGDEADDDRILDYFEYDLGTGVVTKAVADADASRSEFSSTPAPTYPTVPTSWTTASGRGTNLRTIRTVDGIGRETSVTMTSPAQETGNPIAYTVYNDVAHEVRVYPGWTGTTTTGPTQVIREDRDSNPSYVEVLTMTATPTYDGNNKPTGAESIANVQSLSRTFVTHQGLVTHDDEYYNLNGQSYSANPTISGALYYSWQYSYDARGRQYRVLHPTGTVEITNFDVRDRVESEKVGTSDANAVEVSHYYYDEDKANSIGEGNLTRVVSQPQGGASNRDDRFYYDWRNRLVATKAGVETTESTDLNRPIGYYVYNNLNQVTAAELYDGDNTSISFDSYGVPQAPSSSLRRGRSETEYDSLGRPFAEHVYTVNSDGTIPGSNNKLTTSYWYDHVGMPIKVKEPGGLVSKTRYNGVGRPTVAYVSDGGSDTAWSHARTVTDDLVLEQTEYTTYDNFGNVLFVTNKQRFHNETATGALEDNDTAPTARVSFLANYYDAALRLTDVVDVGTYGGSSYTRESSVPARSDTKLVTSFGYQADEVQTIALTGGPTGGTFTLTFDGQTTASIIRDAPASLILGRLQALSNIADDEVSVTGPTSGPWTVRFINGLGEENVPLITGNGSGLTGGTNPAVATASTSDGGDNGRLQKVTDPRGLIAKTDYDLEGRTVRTIENYDNFAPTDADDRTTEFTYDGNDNLTMLTAVLPSNAFQKTEYVYGVSTSTGSALYSNDLLRQVKYPDKSSGSPSSSSADYELFEYNALGETTEVTDRNQTVRSFSYDVVGRPTRDIVDTLGSGVDGAVRRLETAYDTFGRAYLFTSCSSATSCDAGSGTNVVNQVKHEFNGLSQLTADWQAHGGVVGGSTLKVQYAYSDMSANHSRLTTMTYPSGRVLRYEYGTGLDSTISRVNFLADDDDEEIGTHLEEYSYLGLATAIRRARPEPDMDLTYIKRSLENVGDAGDQYTGLDRFGRIVDQRWRDGDTSTHADRFKYGYDRNDNRLYRENEIDDDFDELYHVNGSSNGYDGFNQLVAFSRGPLNSGKDTISSATHSQAWSLDVMGNWSSLTTDGGSAVNRTHNKQNQVTQIGSNSLTFDDNGNTIEYTDGTTKDVVYDAWNRVVEIDDGTIVTSYAYDALGRRTQETHDSETTDLFYSDAWQVLEEREGSSVNWQYVWSPLYVDALILADDLNVISQGFGDGMEGGGEGFDDPGSEPLTQRLYVQQDANWNVTALVDGNATSQTLGEVLERYIYDPYGQPTFLEPDFDTLSASEYDWRYLHQGGRYDEVVNLYNFRNRDLSPSLGRWLQTDPLGYAAGDTNVYRDEFNGPGNFVDPSGLAVCWTCEWPGGDDSSGGSSDKPGSGPNAPGPMIDGGGGIEESPMPQPFLIPRPSCMICHGRPEVLLNGDISNMTPGERMWAERWMNGSYGPIGSMGSAVGDFVANSVTDVWDLIRLGQTNYTIRMVKDMKNLPSQLERFGELAQEDPAYAGGGLLVLQVGLAKKFKLPSTNAVGAYEVGTAAALRARSVVGDLIDIHHVGQAHMLEQLIPAYSRNFGPAIALPAAEHGLIPTLRGTANMTPRQVLANDIWNLRNYTNAPNDSLLKLIELNKQAYPGAFQK